MCTLQLSAQSYTFESNTNHWNAASGGTIALSSEHYKEGSYSLEWTTKGKAQLTISGFTNYSLSTSNSCFMQVYLPEATGDQLTVEFMNGTSVKRTANFVCNYQGWREFSRAYNEYATTATANITGVRITLTPTDDNATRHIYFDDVKLNTSTDAQRVPGTQWMNDVAYLKVNTSPLALYANPIDLTIATPTEQELDDLQTLRQRLTPDDITYNAAKALPAKAWVTNNISVVRNTDGTLLNGTVINTSHTALTDEELQTISERLQNLAAGKKNGTAGFEEAFDNYLDLLLDQGFAEGGNIIFASNSYTTPRQFIPAMLSILPFCSDKQKEGVIGLVKWVCYYGACYYPEETYLSNINSDIVYLSMQWMLQAAALHPDDATAVRDLKAVKRFMERNMDYVQGGGDMLKPDGTGFHHDTHYNNYMYAYQTFADAVYDLRGTCFQISETAYTHFAKALESEYIMATPMVSTSSVDTRYFANSLSGRNTFGNGVKLAFQRARLHNMAEICPYSELQTRLKQLYNACYPGSVNFAGVEAQEMEGVYQFNYSPIAVVRKGNWVATMRAPTSKFWGAEIYSGTNRFGRYQSHGSLEVMYAGTDIAASGYPTTNDGAGWDWNVIPGTTTVHYTDWAEMMPKSNTTQRFDQYSNGTNFAGALAADSIGIFAANLSQTDSWGSQCFTPTNLTAHKSVFIFGDFMVALGSDINSSGAYSDDRLTATNLFQSLISTSNKNKLLVNGTEVSSAYNEVLPAGQSNWLLAPTSTGYWLPATESNVKVIYGEQTTPSHKTNATTKTATAAKAYINHGSKATNASYEFVVVPATDATAMAAWAQQFEAGTAFTVLSQTTQLHAVQRGNTTAYAFYGAADNLTFGIVRTATHQHLLLDTYDAKAEKHIFAACNPNLEPQDDAVYGWVSTPTSATLTLEGEWMAEKPNDAVVFAEPKDGLTEVTITFTDGEPVYFNAVPYSSITSIERPANNTADAPRKVFRDGQVLILRGEQVYDLLGNTIVNQ
ncbi:MAG: polysaccharide lyase family 8 super-sandwich domain-containing protein [Paludibacteraceae bacterium]